MRISFPLTQESYDAWLAHWNARAEDPHDETHPVDVNDMNFVLFVGTAMMKRHPDKIAALAQHLPEAVERAGIDLGMFMGVAWLARQVGLDPDEAQAFGLSLLKP